MRQIEAHTVGAAIAAHLTVGVADEVDDLGFVPQARRWTSSGHGCPT
ncbi:hypothetical protein ACQPXH_31915 [Nocardia sp. CA-135953]